MRMKKVKMFIAEIKAVAVLFDNYIRLERREQERKARKPGKCVDCMFSDIGDGSESGVCRRHPPKIIALQAEVGYSAEIQRSELPEINKADWCGEYRG